MTIPSNSGNNPPISMLDINSDSADGFSLGNNLNGYKGQIYHKKSDGSVGLFPTGSISFSDFYGKRRVDSGSVTDTTSGTKNYTVPPYRTISFVIRAGSGGGGGGGGATSDVNNCGCPPAGDGTSGGNSIFGNSGNAWYLSVSGGTAGTAGTGANAAVSQHAGYDGADAANYDTTLSRAAAGSGTGSGGNGGYPGGSGGRGGKVSSITFTNPILGGSGPVSGSLVPLTVGSYGPGGSAGAGRDYQGNFWIGYSCVAYSPNNGGRGGDGAGGYLTASWT